MGFPQIKGRKNWVFFLNFFTVFSSGFVLCCLIFPVIIFPIFGQKVDKSVNQSLFGPGFLSDFRKIFVNSSQKRALFLSLPGNARKATNPVTGAAQSIATTWIPLLSSPKAFIYQSAVNSSVNSNYICPLAGFCFFCGGTKIGDTTAIENPLIVL